MIQNSHTTIFHIRETSKFFFPFSILYYVTFFEGPMNFAMMKGNLEILKFLNKSINSPNDYQKLPRVRDPRCHFKVVGTGHYNYRSLGIKKIRRLNMSRGNRWFHEKKFFWKFSFCNVLISRIYREGNNALTEDVTRKFAYLEGVNSTGIKHVISKIII